MVVVDDTDLLVSIIGSSKLCPCDGTVTEPAYLFCDRLVVFLTRDRIRAVTCYPDIIDTAIDLRLCDLESNGHQVQPALAGIVLIRCGGRIKYSFEYRNIVFFQIVNAPGLIAVVQIKRFQGDDGIHQYCSVLCEIIHIIGTNLVC